MSCSGPCNRGKKPCPCPQSCHLKQQEEVKPSRSLMVACCITLATWIAACVVAPMIAGYVYG
ncbi:hypothetical protein [Caudoviricetes sp.]|nr:hypothetical protein [Caudoviricetes sp.]